LIRLSKSTHIDVVERRIGRGKDRRGGIPIAKGFGEIRGVKCGGEGAKVVVATDNLDYWESRVRRPLEAGMQ
jgi:hypothetical protein